MRIITRLMILKLKASGKVRIFLSIAAIVIPLMFSVGCARVVNRTAERKIRDILPVYLGPAKVWRAHVDNPPLRTIQGRLSKITIDGEDVQLHNQITCQSLHIVMDNVDIDPLQRKLKSVGKTTFQVVLDQNSLNQYIRSNPLPPDQHIGIRMIGARKGVLILYLNYMLLGKEIPFTISATPLLTSPTTLEMEPDRMTVEGLHIPLPESWLRYLAKYVNHAFDFSSLPFPVTLNQFTVDKNRIELSGSADVMASMNAMMDQRR